VGGLHRSSAVTRCLAFDCSCGNLSIAVVERSGNATTVLAEQREHLQRGHDARLLPALDETLRSAGLRLADMNLIAVTVGPGSFTGVRIGLATARALAQATGLPLAGHTTLAVLLAAASVRASADETIVAAIDSKRGDAYLQLRPGADLPSIGNAQAVHQATRGGPVLLVGDAAAHLAAELARLGAVVRLAADIVTPDAAVLARLSLEQGTDYWHRSGAANGWPRPLYLRAAAVTLADGTRTTAG
jgi:tRNA threonylcarbamoyladenosine biosynthesis protein TsaB